MFSKGGTEEVYEDVAEIREMNVEAANALLKQGWKLLEIKTIKTKIYMGTAPIQIGWTDKRQPVYNEVETIVYVVGRPRDRQGGRLDASLTS